jgi:replication factor C large subunit
MDLTSWMQPEELKKEEVIIAPEETLIAPKKAPTSKTQKIAELPWCEKYRPKTFKEFVGNETALADAMRWANAWDSGNPKLRTLLVYGNVGNGKTSLAYNLAAEKGWEVIETNASDKRTKDLVEHVTGMGTQTRSFSGGRKLILVEEIEGISGIRERGATQALLKVIKDTRTPIILTTNDIKSRKVTPFSRVVQKVPLKKLSSIQIAGKLKDILDIEGIKVESMDSLKKLAENADGDIRSAINDLQSLAQGEETLMEKSIVLQQRDRPIDVYKAMQKVFKATDYVTARRIIWDLDIEPKEFALWMDENIGVEYPQRHELASAYNNLSRADVFLGRISNRQYWGFLRYVNDLLTVGIAFSKDKPYYGFQNYVFPSLIRNMGMTRMKRAKEKSIAGKISPIVHESSRELKVEYLPILLNVFKKRREAGLALAHPFELSDEELEYFLS